MSRKITPKKVMVLLAIVSILSAGIAYALVQVTKDVSTTVTVCLEVPDGIEVYANDSLTQVVSNLDFGDVVVDKFGTIMQPSSVPLWVRNLSAGTFRLDMDDDFPDGEVLFAFDGGPPRPLDQQDAVLDPEEVLHGELSLRFEGAPEEQVHDFTVFFIGEGPTLMPTPTPTATPTTMPPTPTQVTMIFGDEPIFLGAWGEPGCRIIPSHFPCMDGASDPLTYIDSTTFETVPMSGVESWEQIAADRWRFNLRGDVKFHNGEDWNAEAAKMGIDTISDPQFGNASISYTGNLKPAEIVDDMTVDIVCETACPILPKTAFLIWFQASIWYANANETERSSTTVGFGPYKMIGEGLGWRRGLDITMEAYDDYVPPRCHPTTAERPPLMRYR